MFKRFLNRIIRGHRGALGLGGNALGRTEAAARRGRTPASLISAFAAPVLASALLAGAACALPGQALAVEYKEACVGDKLVYSVEQQVNTYGKDAFVRYSTMTMTDALPEGLGYVSAKIYSEAGKCLASSDGETKTAGTFVYNRASRTLTFTFSSTYLKSGMQLKGEKYRLEVTTTIESIPSSGKYSNIAKTRITAPGIDRTLTSNKTVTKIKEPKIEQGKSVYNKTDVSGKTDGEGNLEAHQGDILHYTLTVDQTVKGAAQPATDLADEIPDGLELDASSVKVTGGSTGTVSVAGSTITVNTGRLVYGDRITVEYDCRLTGLGGRLTNTFGVDVPVDVPYRVLYYRDGESSPIYTDEEATSCTEVYKVNDEATKAATRSNCAGLDGWYLDEACTVKYDPAKNGVTNKDKELKLYARNKVTLAYAPTTASWFLQHPETDYYLDEAMTKRMTSQSQILPATETHWYGDTVKLATGAAIYFEDMGVRELPCSKGAYATAAGTGTLMTKATLKANATVYLAWSGIRYDGIYSGD